ncbi:MAG: type I restriction endonuclease subunit R [bacterium]
MNELKTIAESNNFIVLDKYKKIEDTNTFYQSEASLEEEFIKDLINQGYEYIEGLNNTEAMLKNIRVQLQSLNNVLFTDSEWNRFCSEYLDNKSDNHVDRIRKIQENYIYDFKFDNGLIKNIYLVNKKDLFKNRLQVISQFEIIGTSANRYDVTILVNGLPLVQVELKKREVAIKEAFNQIHRYSKESFNSENSLYKFLQLFVISNGTDTRYFANTTSRDKNSFDFTMNWANSKNERIKDIKDFTATFFEKKTILKILLTYSVFDSSENLLIMRPYQIAATERILWKIQSSYNNSSYKSVEGGGYIWHTTGSGKTLTSFKAARLATELDFIDKVFFVVDRKDLDYQTMKEYQRFSPDSVNGSDNTAGLKANMEKEDNKIIVTTLQKLNNFMKTEKNHEIYNKQVVFIFDECHRSQFGEAQKNINAKFKKFYQFGFTGTPIFPENAQGSETTASVFGAELHSYVITDAIRDEKVLKFKVDYNNVNPIFKNFETETDLNKLSSTETKEALLHSERINKITKYILNNFIIKTHRNSNNSKGFNAMFAVSSVEAAKLYYESFKNLQKDSKKPLKVATIFSFAANEEQTSIGEIIDESFEPTAMDLSAKEFLTSAINDYNKMFNCNFGVDSKEFQNYYRDLALRVKKREVDLIIVVGMFLTGFDAPTLNTLFVDKNLRYHGLMQAYSRTNRIYDATKTFGNIVAFRDLEQATIDAIKCFGDSNTKNVVLEKSYDEYINGFKETTSGNLKEGYIDIVNELNNKFPDIDNIITEKDKKSFVKLFSKYLKIENILQNYDEFSYLKAFQKIDRNNTNELQNFMESYFLNHEDIENIINVPVFTERKIQNYKSLYNDVREWLRIQKEGEDAEKSKINWDDVVFEIDLLKSQEINLDYILELIFEKNKNVKDKNLLIEEVRRMIRSSIGNRAKENLIIDFINNTNLDEIESKSSIIEEFFKFAQNEQIKEVEELINEEGLNKEEAKRYITNSLKKEYVSENGTELNEMLPKMSPLNPNYLNKKQTVFQKVSAFVEKFKGVGGKL